MTEPVELGSLTAEEISYRNWAFLGYAMSGLSLFIVFSIFISLGISHKMRSDVKGTFLESHFTYQIRTFWYAVILVTVGIITAYFFIGYVFIFAGALLLIIRNILGTIRLHRCQPM